MIKHDYGHLFIFEQGNVSLDSACRKTELNGLNELSALFLIKLRQNYVKSKLCVYASAIPKAPTQYCIYMLCFCFHLNVIFCVIKKLCFYYFTLQKQHQLCTQHYFCMNFTKALLELELNT